LHFFALLKKIFSRFPGKGPCTCGQAKRLFDYPRVELFIRQI